MTCVLRDIHYKYSKSFGKLLTFIFDQLFFESKQRIKKKNTPLILCTLQKHIYQKKHLSSEGRVGRSLFLDSTQPLRTQFFFVTLRHFLPLGGHFPQAPQDGDAFLYLNAFGICTIRRAFFRRSLFLIRIRTLKEFIQYSSKHHFDLWKYMWFGSRGNVKKIRNRWISHNEI